MTATSNIERKMAVLFADISGSTRLYELLGDARAHATINGCLNILRRVTASHNGRVVKTIGDEVMAVFPDATVAVQAACEMQLEVNAQPLVDNTRIEIRIGFHFGPVLENQRDGDVHGDTVNTASRMANIAQSGQIITSEATVSEFPPIIRSGMRALDGLAIKGKAENIKVFEVIWQESPEMTMMVGHTHTSSQAQAVLRLLHQGREFAVNAERAIVMLGRDEKADVVIQDRRASRMHAKIELRRDKFVFVDQSSNGSYITVNGEDEIMLRREELLLRGSGHICLGHSYLKDPGEVVEFFCEN